MSGEGTQNQRERKKLRVYKGVSIETIMVRLLVLTVREKQENRKNLN